MDKRQSTGSKSKNDYLQIKSIPPIVKVNSSSNVVSKKSDASLAKSDSKSNQISKSKKSSSNNKPTPSKTKLLPKISKNALKPDKKIKVQNKSPYRLSLHQMQKQKINQKKGNVSRRPSMSLHTPQDFKVKISATVLNKKIEVVKDAYQQNKTSNVLLSDRWNDVYNLKLQNEESAVKQRSKHQERLQKTPNFYDHSEATLEEESNSWQDPITNFGNFLNLPGATTDKNSSTSNQDLRRKQKVKNATSEMTSGSVVDRDLELGGAFKSDHQPIFLDENDDTESNETIRSLRSCYSKASVEAWMKGKGFSALKKNALPETKGLKKKPSLQPINKKLSEERQSVLYDPDSFQHNIPQIRATLPSATNIQTLYQKKKESLFRIDEDSEMLSSLETASKVVQDLTEQDKKSCQRTDPSLGSSGKEEDLEDPDLFAVDQTITLEELRKNIQAGVDTARRNSIAVAALSSKLAASKSTPDSKTSNSSKDKDSPSYVDSPRTKTTPPQVSNQISAITFSTVSEKKSGELKPSHHELASFNDDGSDHRQKHQGPGISFSEFTDLLESDLIFLDYFNKFLVLPIFGQTIYYDKLMRDFSLYPSQNNNKFHVDGKRLRKFLYKKRFIRFIQTPFYLEYRLNIELSRANYLDSADPKVRDAFKFLKDTFIAGVSKMRAFRKFLLTRCNNQESHLMQDSGDGVVGDTLKNNVQHKNITSGRSDLDTRDINGCRYSFNYNSSTTNSNQIKKFSTGYVIYNFWIDALNLRLNIEQYSNHWQNIFVMIRQKYGDPSSKMYVPHHIRNIDGANSFINSEQWDIEFVMKLSEKFLNDLKSYWVWF